MRRLERINDFLNLIKEIAKSNIEVDANLLVIILIYGLKDLKIIRI